MLTGGIGGASPSPNSRGGSELRLRLKDNYVEAGSEDNLGGVAKGVEWDMGGGSRGRRSGVYDLLRPHDGLALAPCLCFALRSSKVPSCPHDHFTLASTAVLTIVVFASWRAPTGPF